MSKVSEGIVRLFRLLYQASKETMKLSPQIPILIAASTLMVRALDFAERGMGEKITPEILAACTKATMEAVLKEFGITSEMMAQAVANGKPTEQPPTDQPQPPQPSQPMGLIGQGA